MSFPISPTDGQTTIVNGIKYIYNSANNYWVKAVSSANRYTASTSPPATPTVGDQWYDTVEDVLYEFIDDGTTSYWVDIQTSIIAATAATNPGDLHPFLLAGM
jgi:hypothetical protein